MKTEITLDEAIAARLNEAAKIAGITFNQALNTAVSYGLSSLPRKTASARPYRTKPHRFGISLDNPKGALARLDEESDLAKVRLLK
jgi:hypothetical protein